MKILVLILVIQFALRLTFQPALEAIASTAFLLFFVALSYRFGGWKSLRSAREWLANRPFFAWLIFGGVIGVIALAFTDDHFSASAIVAEAIGAYFVFHAFCALGDWLTDRLKRIRGSTGSDVKL